jgi:hypothetical protein
MKKNIFFAAIALVALVGCTSDDFVGNQSLQEANNSGGAINFTMKTPAVTRADRTGADAAGDLNRNFVVFGYKTVSGTASTVFDNYQVNWVTGTAGSTESNTADWEYVSYKNLPYGTTTTSGGTLNNNGVSTNATGSSTNIIQSIKYWDFSASSYDFFAYSLGAGVTESSTTTWAKASALSNSTYTLEGTAAQLGTCYISKKKHIAPPSSAEVDLVFLSFLSKIQLKFFETIPGYSVKDVRFYTAASTKSTGAEANDGLAPALYTSSTIPTGGKYTIAFDENYDPVVTLTGSASSTATSISFPVAETGTPAKWLSGLVGKEYQEADETVYLGRAANAASASKQITVLPNSTGATMNLKVDYTLVSRDGSSEVITVTGATATVPADFTKWKPNYAYTYIFKISDNTNGSTGSSTTGLYPITLDAIVTEDLDGSQTTITTVDETSITTYQNGAVANEYSAGNIYVVVGDGTTALTSTNAKLYTATIEAGAAQGLDSEGKPAITEEMVANALTKTPDGSGNYVLTDANTKKLTVTPVASDATDKLVVGETSIPTTDAPGGKELTVKCAKFAASNNTVYVFEYIDGSNKYYKVIKVGTPTAITPAP